MTESEQRAAVVAEARTWLGTRWTHAQRCKGSGVDCAEFIAAVFETAGVLPHVEIEPYQRDWAQHNGVSIFQRQVERFGVRVDRPALPGDIVLFRFGQCLSHGGIVVAWPTIIHAYSKQPRRVTLDDVERNAELASRLGGIWSFWPEGRI